MSLAAEGSRPLHRIHTVHALPRLQPRGFRPHWRSRPPTRIRQDVSIDAGADVVAMAIAWLTQLRRTVVPLAPVELAATGAPAEAIEEPPATPVVAAGAAGVGAASRLARRAARGGVFAAMRATRFARAVVARPRQRRSLRPSAAVRAVYRRPAAACRQVERSQARDDASSHQHPDSPFNEPPRTDRRLLVGYRRGG